MKHILAFGIVLGLAGPVMADPYQANMRSKQADAHEMRDVRGQGAIKSAQAPVGSPDTDYVAEYRPMASTRR